MTTVTVNGAGTIVEHESPTGATVFGGELGKGTASLDSESRALRTRTVHRTAPRARLSARSLAAWSAMAESLCSPTMMSIPRR